MTTLINWMNRSARILSSRANPGANRPHPIPRVMPTSTQNHSWVYKRFLRGAVSGVLSCTRRLGHSSSVRSGR